MSDINAARLPTVDIIGLIILIPYVGEVSNTLTRGEK